MFPGNDVYADRAEAGRALAERLHEFASAHPVVVALPRGGVPVGFEVAMALDAPLDLVFVRKIGHPNQPEFAIGAVADGRHPERVLNRGLFEETEVSDDYLRRQTEAKLAELRAMERKFARHRPHVAITHRTVIVVDDGIATGATVRVVIHRLRREYPYRIIVATPVASSEAVHLLRDDADEVVCLQVPGDFNAVGNFYRDFSPVQDAEVARLLDKAKSRVTL